MGETFLVLAAALAVAYGCVSALANRTILTPPMGFMIAGLVCGPLGLSLIDADFDSSTESKFEKSKRCRFVSC
jgi:Kef-type K+ transport system membrane component KefB